MIRIAITPPDIIDRVEARNIATILDAGWDRVHLRHSGASTADVRRILDDVPLRLHNRIVLHGHFDLVNDYNLGGLHLNHRCPVPPALYRGALSMSCHSVDEALSMAAKMTYVTLSPIFDSVSKAGYTAAFSPEELARVAQVDNIIALGGVTPARTKEVAGMGFAGYAVLGSIPWGASQEELISRLKEFE